MSFNIGLMSEKEKKAIEAEKAAEHKFESKEYRKEGDKDPNNFSSDEYQRMVKDDYIFPGVKVIKIRCKACSREVDCSETSPMRQSEICVSCNKRKGKGGGVIEV